MISVLQISFFCCFCMSLYVLIKAAVSDLRSLPGPFFGRISKYYRVWLLHDGRGPIRYWDLHQQYGPVVRVSPKHVSLSDPAMVPIIYDVKGRLFKVSNGKIGWSLPLIREEPFLRHFQASLSGSSNGYHFHHLKPGCKEVIKTLTHGQHDELPSRIPVLH